MSERIPFNFEEQNPGAVWKHFAAISKLPRCSKNEAAVVHYAEEIARKNNHKIRKDSAGNLLITVPASSKKQQNPSVCLQSHLDMVCEKNEDVRHDFSKDPLKLFLEGEMLFADGTTLGADNGIGAAMMLALAENYEGEHPELELLFTVDEEAGMSGAFGIEDGFLGSKRLINLDTEDEGYICIGCSGGMETELSLKMKRIRVSDLLSIENKNKAKPEKLTALRMDIKNLRGGHSGLNIHLGRANAVKLLGRFLKKISENHDVFVSSLGGGRARNAIPREAYAEILCEVVDSVKSILEKEMAAVQKEYSGIDDRAALEISEIHADHIYSMEDSGRIIDLINTIPAGVISMSSQMPDLVETSTNPGILKMENDTVILGCLTRSSKKTEQKKTVDLLADTGAIFGFQARHFGEYPPWEYNLDSKLLNDVLAIYKNRLGSQPKTIAVHAGLETGIIGEKFPGMDMISLGPDIFFPHSPREHVSVQSVERVWNELTVILEHL